MDKKWSNITPLSNSDVISELELKCNTTTTSLFRDFIHKFNNGKINPMPYIYDSARHFGCVFSKVLSFNKEDENNVFSIIEDIGNIDFIPFAMSKEPDKLFVIQKNIVYVFNKKTGERDKVSGNFGNFTILLR